MITSSQLLSIGFKEDLNNETSYTYYITPTIFIDVSLFLPDGPYVRLFWDDDGYGRVIKAKTINELQTLINFF